MRLKYVPFPSVTPPDTASDQEEEKGCLQGIAERDEKLNRDLIEKALIFSIALNGAEDDYENAVESISEASEDTSGDKVLLEITLED